MWGRSLKIKSLNHLRNVKFKDFIQLQRGFDLPKYDLVNGPYPVIGSTSIIGHHNQYKVEPPGVVTGRSGSLGQLQFIREKYWPHNTSLWVRDFKGNYPRYVYYFLKSLDLSNFNSGAGVPTLNRNHLDTMELLIHPISDQHRIATILSAYDDLIDNNTRRIRILEEMAQAIYREWFVDFRFPVQEGVRMVESELGLVPEGWQVIELDKLTLDIIDYRGKTPKKLDSDWSTEGIPAISALNIKKGELIHLEKTKRVSEELYKKWMKSELESGDILMTSEAPLGELFFLVTKKRFCLSQRVYCIRADSSRIKPIILYFSLDSPLARNEIQSRATGTTVLGIRQSLLRKIPVITPPIHLQEKLEQPLSNIFRMRENLIDKNTNLRRTRDLLLPKLISGELDVSELDIEVPAA